MVKAGGLKLLTELLLKNEDENITLEAIEALASILEHRAHCTSSSCAGNNLFLFLNAGDFIDAFIKEGGLKALIPLISDESESTQAAAGGLVYALATQGIFKRDMKLCCGVQRAHMSTLDHIKTWFLAEGLIAPILKLMHSEEPITRKNSIKIISQLVLNGTVMLMFAGAKICGVFLMVRRQTRLPIVCSGMWISFSDCFNSTMWKF